MPPKVSIISPVYNTERYLAECIESVLGQTFSDFEFILVNDGSKDASLDIIKSYAAADKRIRVIDKPNCGVSRARNTGIESATGDYIAFIDSDDMILSDYLSQHLEPMAEKDYDLVCSSMTEFGEGHLNPAVNLRTGSWTLDDESQHASFYDLYYLTSPVSKLYKRSIIIDNALRFDPNLSLAEDKKFNLQYYKCISNVKSLDYNGYRYRKGITDSLSSTKRDTTEVFKVEVDLWDIKKSDFMQRGHNSDLSVGLIARDAINHITDYIERCSNTHHFKEFKRNINSANIDGMLKYIRQHQRLLSPNQVQRLLMAHGPLTAFLAYKLMNIKKKIY